MNYESVLPSDEWQSPRVHWHAFADPRPQDTPPRTSERVTRRERVPDTVLRTPWAIASWIDQQTRQYVHHRQVWAASEGDWVAIGDEDDLEHLRQENFAIASRGDSIYTDVHTEHDHHDLYAEAVTDDQCTHGCSTDDAT